jgi:hypothetical protein
MSDDGYTATELGMLRAEADNERADIKRDEEREQWQREIDKLTKCECGHPYREHGAVPPYTGYEWCEGGGVTDLMDYKDAGHEVSYTMPYWTCRCREYNGPDPDDVREQLNDGPEPITGALFR